MKYESEARNRRETLLDASLAGTGMKAVGYCGQDWVVRSRSGPPRAGRQSGRRCGVAASARRRGAHARSLGRLRERRRAGASRRRGADHGVRGRRAARPRGRGPARGAQGARAQRDADRRHAPAAADHERRSGERLRRLHRHAVRSRRALRAHPRARVAAERVRDRGAPEDRRARSSIARPTRSASRAGGSR